MSKTKKIIIMSGLVLLLAVTAVFKFVLSGTLPGNAGTDGVKAAKYFLTYWAGGEKTRQEESFELGTIL